MNISKKLVESVIGEDVYGTIIIEDNVIKYCTLDKKEHGFDTFNNNQINIYEFAFKCKEWVISQGIAIESGKYKIDDDEYICRYYLPGRCSIWQNYFGLTELEAIFKACACLLKIKG